MNIRKTFLLSLALLALYTTASAQLLNGEARLIDHINRVNPKVIKEKGLTPEQAVEAEQAARRARLVGPARTAYTGPARNQEFWFIMPQGVLLGYPYGVHYCTGGDGSVRLLAEDLTHNMTARFNGALVDGKLHTIVGDLDWVDEGLVIARDQIFDPSNNWQLYQSVNISDSYYLISQEVAVDPTTHRVYGTFLRDDYYTYDIAWVNYSTREIHRIGPAQRDYPGLGMNSEGRLFGVDMDGILYEISLEDGTDRVIGNTGLSVRDEDDRYFYQSAECGVRDNVLYWAPTFPDGSSALYAVDLTTAEATKIHDFPKYTLIHCLTVPDTMADDGAPAVVSGLQAQFQQTATTGTLSFTMPTTTYNGQPLTGELGYVVRIDGDEGTAGTAAAGTAVSVEKTLAEGLHFVEVYAENTVGRSAQANLSVFVGMDEPGQPQEPTLLVSGDVATVSWQPTQGVNGGYAGNLTYTVTRYPDGTVVAADITATSLTDQVPLGDWRRVSYGITAGNGTKTGSEATTNAVAVGTPYVAPYYEDFLTRNDFLDNYTVVDANGDGVSWRTNITSQTTWAIYSYNAVTHWSNVAADDWFFTPTFALQAGKTYELSFLEGCYGSDAQCVNKIEVTIGKGTTPEAMTTVLVPLMEYKNNTAFNTIVKTFTVPEDGNYNIAFHALSDQRKTDFILDAVQLVEATTANSPAKVGNLKMTPAEKGALQATVTFNAPTKTKGGANLSSLTKVRVMRKNKVLHTFENPTPGEQLSFTDTAPENGYNSYAVVATNEVSDGAIDEVTGYVGIDVPAFDFTSVGLEDNDDHITVKWAQVGTTGLNGAYVDPAAVAYAVYRVEYELESGMMTADQILDIAVGTDHLDLPVNTYEGDQTVVSYAVLAFNEVGADENHTGATYGMVIGQPYALPFIQSASNSRLGNKMMWAETDNNPDVTYGFSADSYDKDNGSFEWAPQDRSNILSLNTGKISLAGANTPTLRFAHKADPKTRLQLAVKVQTPDREETTLKSINYQNITGDEADWTLESIDLSDFRNEDYIVVKFYMSSNATTNTSIKGKVMRVDAINVLDSQPYNLSIDIEAPETIVAGSGDAIDVVVHNVGERDATGYSVSLLIDDEEVFTETVSEPLRSLERRVLSYNYRPSVFGASDRITARAELTWLYDLVDEDNEMEEEILISAPVVRQPEEAFSQKTDAGLSLTWKAPEQVAEKVVDSFEGKEYTDFDLGGITMDVREGKLGDWTMWNLDGDGTWNGPSGPTGHLPDYDGSQLEGVSFPNMGSVCAWMVLNQNQVIGNIGGRSEGTIYGGDTPITPRTGNKMAATFDDFVRQDTWLISPELSGNAQDVIFYAAAPSTSNVSLGQTSGGSPDQVEVIELLVSYGGLSKDDFESLGTDTLYTQEWIDYELELEEGTKYFAVRNVSGDYNALALFIDDVTFERLSALPASYNIYGDEQLLQNVTLGEPFAVDGRAARYCITAVYANGDESLPVYFVEGTQGITDLRSTVPGADRVYDLSGRRVSGRSSLGKGVYIVNGKTVILK
ncbi:MAG: choice-of-anchor J domain-containing protein [Prevotella sp.]|nr:choice-of-anchor J domain-containing protein [Prevotella sp.]